MWLKCHKVQKDNRKKLPVTNIGKLTQLAFISLIPATNYKILVHIGTGTRGSSELKATLTQSYLITIFNKRVHLQLNKTLYNKYLFINWYKKSVGWTIAPETILHHQLIFLNITVLKNSCSVKWSAEIVNKFLEKYLKKTSFYYSSRPKACKSLKN